MLSEHLKELIKNGFVDKLSYEGYTLRVEYFLTENRGKRILKSLEIMQNLGIEILDSENIKLKRSPQKSK